MPLVYYINKRENGVPLPGPEISKVLTLDPNDLGATLWAILLWSAVFLGFFFYLYRNRIFSIFDPLVALPVAQAAYSVMGLALIHSPFLLIQLLASQVALSIGFLSVRKPRLQSGSFVWTSQDIDVAEWTIFLLFLLYLAANIWLGIAAGFPIFADDPSAAKFSVYAGGLGLVRRINAGIGIVVPAGALLLTVRGHHNKLFGLLFGSCVILASLSGAKGALVIFLQIIALVVYRKDIISESVRKRLRTFSIALSVAAVLLAVAVLYVVTKDTSLALTGFLRRILLQGDSIIYYYEPSVFPHFQTYGPMDFVYMVLNPLLGGLRLVPYMEPVGYQMIKYYLGNSLLSDYVFGPNTPFFLVGHIYFGSFFGVIYCWIAGYFVARMRISYMEAERVSPLRLIWRLSVGLLAYNLPTEVTLFTGPLIDMAVLLVITTAIAHILVFVLRASVGDVGPFLGKETAWGVK